MENVRFVYICRCLLKASQTDTRTVTCRQFFSELGLSDQSIGETKLDPENSSEDEDVILRRKIVKVVYRHVRVELCKRALVGKIIQINQPLPKLGSWESDDILIQITKAGLLRTQYLGNKDYHGNRVINPLGNDEFLSVLAEG